MYHQRHDEPDILRARFTNWIEKLIKNAKIDYLRQLSKEPQTISIEELHCKEQLIGEYDVAVPVEEATFDFQEEKLANAFYKLPLMKKRILELLFIEDLEPEEIARKLNCSAQYVYNQRYRALKQLKEQLGEGDNV